MRIGWELLGWFLIRWKLAEYCTPDNCRRWELGECWTLTIWTVENWVSIGLRQFEWVRIGWALDFNNLNWWELGEHWTLTIWTGENWVSIGLWQFELVRIGWALDLEPFEVVRTKWTMDLQIQYIGDVVIGDWGLQATQSKWWRLQRGFKKICGYWLGAV